MAEGIASDGEIDLGIGGVALLVRTRPSGRTVLAAGISGAAFSASETIRLAGEIALGTELLGGAAGLSTGPVLDLDRRGRARVGGHVALWGFAGPLPYVRISVVEQRGIALEAGLAIAFPTARW